MKAYSIEEMKQELYTIGDFTKAEVNEMTTLEILQAWNALPAIV